jgi:hypothetical protein
MMKKIEFKHIPTDKIPKDMKYKYYCAKDGCNNIIMGCDELPPLALREMISATPCSNCVEPAEYIKAHIKKWKDKL